MTDRELHELRADLRSLKPSEPMYNDPALIGIIDELLELRHLKSLDDLRGMSRHKQFSFECLTTGCQDLKLRKWVDDLQSGMYINCVYCGHRYGPQSEVPANPFLKNSRMADALKAHIEVCPEHPMSRLKKEHEALALALLDADTLLYTLSMEFCHIDKDALAFCAGQRLEISKVLQGKILEIAQMAHQRKYSPELEMKTK